MHFFAISANLMRRILVDHARSKKREKRGGDGEILQVDETMIVMQNEKSVDLIGLDEAISRLEELDERQSRVAELRYLSGLSLEETAEAMELSLTTVAQDWAMAKAWLHREFTK